MHFKKMRWWGLCLIVFCVRSVGGFADSDLIVGGQLVSDQEQWTQYTVALLSKSQKGEALCTGVVVSKKYILTAAHCVADQTKSLEILTGINLKQKSDSMEVDKAFVYPGYHPNKLDKNWGDLALVKIKGKLLKGLKPVSFWPDQVDLKKDQKAYLAGYGVDGMNGSSEKISKSAGILRKTEIRIEDPQYSQTEILLDQGHGQGACHGDSGGPALAKLKSKFYLFGITSRSPLGQPNDCAHQVIYTKVSAFKDWIEQIDPKVFRVKASE